MKKIITEKSISDVSVENISPFQLKKKQAQLTENLSVIVLREGLDEIQNAGWAVAMQYRFKYEFPAIHRDSFSYLLNYDFLEHIEFFTKLFDVGNQINQIEIPELTQRLSDGIFIQFGLKDEKLILILSIIYDSQKKPKDRKLYGKIYKYFTPKKSGDGIWDELSENDADEYKGNFEQTNFDAINGKPKITGYFIGRGVIEDIFVFNTRIKIYLGLYTGRDISDYETDNSNNELSDLQLIMVECDTPQKREIDEKIIGPLAGYDNIYSTMECDRFKYNEGWLIDNSAGHNSGNSSCIKNSPEEFGVI